MFTGIVEEVGSIRKAVRQGMAMELTIACRKVLEGVQLGDSIAVNGVCLTVTRFGEDYFTADVMPETMKRTNLGSLSVGSPVNLERALAAGQRLGGHFVQGHVDGVGTITDRTPYENAVLFRISVPSELTRFMVEKGSVAVNGISLTLVDVGKDFFTVSVIPHTLTHTQLHAAKVGDPVNVECDMIGKYIAKMLGKTKENEGLTLETLRQNGFA
ncbi:riboflavin synthase [Polycladomyces sp. WAk]|uniref:Riboflavin synthase n=1 Tax=Polycladomyces zharkentensis TaxID=2807616 RepID=A0ABS2WJP6_9BACL|nr:riboflavin synthase [Polycladomyces sp. WAk]MBN2909754.1 riboflavin synthase [Polycladomyces sp. WAk]